MLLSKSLIIKWNGNQRKYYEEKGYLFTKYGDEFECKVEDIPHSSDRIIECECDYCHNIFTKQIKKFYKHREIVQKDACEKCGSIKMKESRILKYGTTSILAFEKAKKFHDEKIEKQKAGVWLKFKQICMEKGYELQTDKYINNETKLPYMF